MGVGGGGSCCRGRAGSVLWCFLSWESVLGIVLWSMGRSGWWGGLAGRCRMRSFGCLCDSSYEVLVA